MVIQRGGAIRLPRAPAVLGLALTGTRASDAADRAPTIMEDALLTSTNRNAFGAVPAAAAEAHGNFCVGASLRRPNPAKKAAAAAAVMTRPQ